MIFLKKLKDYIKHERFEIIREILITIIISAVITFALNYYLSNKQDQRISSREFIYEFSRTFFDVPKYRNLSIALEDNYLYGDEVKYIDRSRFTIGKNIFSEYELDDYLGLLGDIDSFYRDGFISRGLLDRQYAYYMCIAYKSKEVENYRKKLVDQNFSDTMSYSFLDNIAETLDFVSKDCRSL